MRDLSPTFSSGSVPRGGARRSGRLPVPRLLAPLLLALSLLFPPPAWGGAWTQAPGAGFLSAQTVADPDGPTGLRRDRYVELGMMDGVTVGMNSNHTVEIFDQNRFRGRVESFLRTRLWQGSQGDVISSQVEIGSGFGSPWDKADVTTRLMWGRGYVTALGPSWAEAAIGWRHQLEDGETDRALASAALGLRPAPGWLAMAGVETDLDGERTGRDWQVLRLRFTAAREIGRGDSVSLQIEAAPWAEAVSDGVQIRLGLWRAF